MADLQDCGGRDSGCEWPARVRRWRRPADLRIHMAPGVHTDGELYYWVSYGFPGSAMLAWKTDGHLTDEQIWSVINYARATFDDSGQ